MSELGTKLQVWCLYFAKHLEEGTDGTSTERQWRWASIYRPGISHSHIPESFLSSCFCLLEQYLMLRGTSVLFQYCYTSVCREK